MLELWRWWLIKIYSFLISVSNIFYIKINNAYFFITFLIFLIIIYLKQNKSYYIFLKKINKPYNPYFKIAKKKIRIKM